MRQNYRYKIMLMMVIITVINYIDRGAISYGQKAIIKEFGFNPISWGAVLSYFGYGYLFGSVIGGVLSDKKGPKFVWVTIGTAWSIFVMTTAIAGNVGQALFGGSALAGFAVVRILFGFSEGPMFSTINKTNANWAAPKERGFAASIGLIGTPLGAMLTAPVAVALLSFTSWKTVFIILGILGFIWVAVWSKMFKDMPEQHPKVSKDELARIRSKKDLLAHETIVTEADKNAKWFHFFKNPTLVLNAVGYFAFQYVNFLLLTWTPKYLQDQFHFELSSLWYLGMIPWIGAIFTVIIGGRLSDSLRIKTGSLRIARSGLAVVSLLLTAACFMLIPTQHSIVGVMVLMAVGNAFNFLPNSVYWTVVVDTAPGRAGTYGGITHFITNIATVVAPALTGFLVVKHGYSSMFVAAAIAAVIGMIAMIFVKPGVKQAKQQAAARIAN